MAWPSVVSPKTNLKPVDQTQKAFTLQLVQQIHYYIECCLVRNLNLDETTCALQQLGVQPCLTNIVWKQLELQNPDFFCLYCKDLFVTESLCTSTQCSNAE